MNNPPTNSPFSILSRLRACLGLKLVLLVVLNLWVYVPYHFLQRYQFYPGTEIPASILDSLIPFSDHMVWLYLSIYLLMPIGPFLMTGRPQLIRYAVGIALISLLADLVFFFWPTTCPRPVVEAVNPAYRLLVLIDNPFHAFPSLHAAFAVYSALCLELLWRELRGGWFWRGGVWAWTFLILMATLATSQHMIVDLVAGSVLAIGVFYCVVKPRTARVNRKPLPTAVTLTEPDSTTQ